MCVSLSVFNFGLSDDGEALPRRPGSSRYRILPSIGKTSRTEASVSQAHCLHKPSRGQKPQQNTEPSRQKNVGVRDKPTAKSRDRLQKDVKLSDKRGSNVEDKKSTTNRGDVEALISEPSRVSSVDQQVVELAVKLPSGQRIEHRFQSTDRLSDVLHYAETVAGQGFTNCEFVSADRRTVYTDLSLTIASSAVQSRSVLYLQLPEDT